MSTPSRLEMIERDGLGDIHVRRRLADALLRPPYVSVLLRFATTHIGWSPGARRAMAAWKLFLRSSAFDEACDSFDPGRKLDFLTHLLATAEPRLKERTSGRLWTWFDIAWVTRHGYEDETISNRMTYWILGWSGDSKDQPAWSRNAWIEFWIRRAGAAVRAFDASGGLFEHVKRWAGDVENRILALRARGWTDLERELVVQWLMGQPLKRLVLTALSRGVPPDSVDDAIQSFWIAQGFDGLKGVLANYEPRPGTSLVNGFIRFVATALGNDAARFAAQTRTRSERELCLDEDSDPQGEQRRSELPWNGLSVEEVLMDQESRDVIRSAVARCWPKLTGRERSAITSLLRGHTHRETADALGISESAAKVAAHRARHRLRTLLAEEGVRSPVFAACLSPREPL